jgi:hypothetical protein
MLHDEPDPMDPSLRIVSRIPLVELWNDEGRLDAVRVGPVGEADIARLLGEPGTSLAVADAGKPLRWVNSRERFDFWKTEVKRRLVAPEATGFRVEDFQGGYCYVATEWRVGAASSSVILLERQH